MIRRRLRPFAGLPLSAEDLQAEQSYHRDALRRHHVRHHGWGIVEGLACEALPAQNAILVSRGWALTRRGDEVELPAGQALSLDDAGVAPGGEYRLILRFVEIPDPRSAVAPFGGGEPEPARIDEGAELAVVPADLPGTEDEVELCRFRVDAAGRLAGGEIDRDRADRLRPPSRPEAAPLREAVHQLADSLRLLPGLLPPSGADAAWLAMCAASAQMVLLGGAPDPDGAAALGARLLAAAEAWLARGAPERIAAALAEPVRAALLEWSEREAGGAGARADWARRWVPRLVRAVDAARAEAADAMARPAFRELHRSPAPGGSGGSDR